MKDKLEFEAPPPERLTIAHLLVWTAMSAALLGYQRAMTSLTGEQTLFSTVVTLWFAPLFGAGLSACVLCFWRLTNGGPRFPAQPGHWLLIISGIGALISLVFQTVSVLALAGVSSFEIFIAIRLAEFLAVFALFALALWRTPGIWRCAFAMGLLQMAVMMLLGSLGLFSSKTWFFAYFRSAELTLHGLMSIVVLGLAVLDFTRRVPRDYLHWTGIAVRLIYSALIVAIPWLFRWLQPAPQ